jgi:hypothetical protein
MTNAMKNMSTIKLTRGRRKNSDNPRKAKSDRTMSRTVYQLSAWGFPLRTSAKSVGAFELVGLRAAKAIQRFDHDEKPLGPDRVEQIFEDWFSTENAVRRGASKWPLLKRSRYLRESLRETVPLEARRLSIEHVVDLLLENGGQSPWSSPRYTGDLALSPKERAKKGILNERAVHGVVQRMTRLWVEKHGPVTIAQAEVLQQMFVRTLGIAYRADALGGAPDSLKNRVEK